MKNSPTLPAKDNDLIHKENLLIQRMIALAEAKENTGDNKYNKLLNKLQDRINSEYGIPITSLQDMIKKSLDKNIPDIFAERE